MGNSLHNKIYLGRSSALRSTRAKAALLLGMCAGIGVVWLLARAFR